MLNRRVGQQLVLRRILLRQGISREQIEPYRWLGKVFADTYGRMFSERLTTPMGFFGFRK